jgi:dolichyl-phosphate-mannose--protein O-mannosyl transferase
MELLSKLTPFSQPPPRSCKWVGLFVTAYIGLQTLHQLWTLFGTPTVSLSKFAQHFIARAICLIAIPVALYIGFFVIHFWALPLTGPGSNFMSEEFREGLQQVQTPAWFIIARYAVISSNHPSSSFLVRCLMPNRCILGATNAFHCLRGFIAAHIDTQLLH